MATQHDAVKPKCTRFWHSSVSERYFKYHLYIILFLWIWFKTLYVHGSKQGDAYGLLQIIQLHAVNYVTQTRNTILVQCVYII